MMSYLDRTFLDGLEIASGGLTEFHRQSSSRTGGGSARSKQLASPLWAAQYQTAQIPIQDAYELEAQLTGLNGALGRIELYQKLRSRPRDSGGIPLTDRTLQSIGSDRHNVIFGGFGFQRFRIGDMFSFASTTGGKTRQHLHKITKVNSTLNFQVWPAISLNAQEDVDIELDRPFGIFQIDAAAINEQKLNPSSIMHASISFKAIQVLE